MRVTLIKKLPRQREKCFFCYSHQGRAAHHGKNDYAPKLVMRQIESSQMVAQFGKQKRNKAGHPLQTEEYHCRQADPRVQAVHVGYGRGLLIVRVKN